MKKYIYLLVAILISACSIDRQSDVEYVVGPQGPQGIQGEKGEKGDPGQDGQDGQDGENGTVVVAFEFESSEKCPNGGVLIETYASDGTVIDSIEVCNGLNGQDGADGQNGQDGQDGQDGADGSDGADGADGTSITFEVTEEGECTTITIIINGEPDASFTFCNGRDGEDGQDGEDGEDGEDGQDGTNGGSETVTICHKVVSKGNPNIPDEWRDLDYVELTLNFEEYVHHKLEYHIGQSTQNDTFGPCED